MVTKALQAAGGEVSSTTKEMVLLAGQMPATDSGAWLKFSGWALFNMVAEKFSFNVSIFMGVFCVLVMRAGRSKWG